MTLRFNDTEIRDRGEMLSLTDMWRAAGSPSEKRPNDWASRAGQDFVEAVALTHNAATGGILRTTRGRYGSTFGHWQVALGYAQYLSPEFHMWCNTIVRERMEGKHGHGLTADQAVLLERIDGISRMVAHKVGEAVEQAYRRGNALTKRRKLKEAWAAYCDRPPAISAATCSA